MKFKGRLVSLTALILSVLLVFSGCSILAKNKDAETEDAYVDVFSDEIIESEVYYNQGDDLVTMHITKAEPFKDGYAYLCLEDTIGTKYNAITDKNGNITFFQEKSVRGDFRNSNEGYFYFEKIVGYKRESISCINYNGEEIYEIEFKETETLSSYQVEDWGDDGTVVISRKVTGFDVSYIEIAWISADGEYLLDWTMIDKEIESIFEFDYCERGFSYCITRDSKKFLLNLKNGVVYALEKGGSESGEFMGDYLGIKKGTTYYSVSTTGELVAEVNYNDWKIGPVNKFENDASDSLILNSSDWSLYDSSLTKKVAELDVPESSKGKPMSCTSFINGKAVLFIQDSNYQNYFTVINNKGEMMFEPKPNPGYGNETFAGVRWDGETLMQVSEKGGDTKYSYADFYDLNGNIIQKIDFRNTDKYRVYEIERDFSEGLVPVSIDTDEYANIITVI